MISKFWSRELQSWEMSWKSKWFMGPHHSIGQVPGEFGSDQFSVIFASGFQAGPLLVLDFEVCKQVHASKSDFILKFSSDEVCLVRYCSVPVKCGWQP